MSDRQYYGLAVETTPIAALTWIVKYTATRVQDKSISQPVADRMIAEEVRKVLDQVNSRARELAAQANPAFAAMLAGEAA